MNLSNLHWTLAGIDARKEELFYFDSLGHDDENLVLENLFRWFLDELLTKTDMRSERLSRIESWKFIINPPYAPRQSDSESCGIFVLYSADFLELDLKNSFFQKDVPVLRQRTSLFLSRNRLENHPEYIHSP